MAGGEGIGTPFVPFSHNLIIPDSDAKGGLKYTGTTNPDYAVGTTTYDVDSQKAYMYVLNGESSALDKDDAHILQRVGHSSNKWKVLVLDDDTTKNYIMLCVPCADIAASSYGWVQIYGTATVEEATNITDEAWTAGNHLIVTAGKLKTAAAGTYGFASASAGVGAIAMAAASAASTATTREIELIGTLVSTDT